MKGSGVCTLRFRVKGEVIILNILIHWLFELTSSCGPTGLRFDPLGGQHFLSFFLVYKHNYPFLNIKTTRVLEFSVGLLWKFQVTRLKWTA